MCLTPRDPETAPASVPAPLQELPAPQSVNSSKIVVEQASFRLATGHESAMDSSPITGPIVLRTARPRATPGESVARKSGTTSGTIVATGTGSATSGGKNIRTPIGDSIRSLTGGGGEPGAQSPLAFLGDRPSRPTTTTGTTSTTTTTRFTTAI